MKIKSRKNDTTEVFVQQSKTCWKGLDGRGCLTVAVVKMANVDYTYNGYLTKCVVYPLNRLPTYLLEISFYFTLTDSLIPPPPPPRNPHKLSQLS